ncbi:hypothetical protein [Afifella marina]|uniref:Uncharacterized protein n=1 Tax=Afifella marina DSM 2698 TaxID=1120955 RepID=A0A1G5M6F3_AFIMA|nr:hypothetical protein [Afifella marina]MBK1626000.1 hypothetical protein [Afifella marina]MBK5917824.1 hypothetical protein [Afifella marina]RAI18234.1 hypothetical protein CH311_16220 [Afifella marina DSM 2698]SCZ19949.1 hypothetical protein SAMN03080610_00076 [Afifella marina DSM 2698]
MRSLSLAVVFLMGVGISLSALAPAIAAEPPRTANGVTDRSTAERYVFVPIEKGALRLDTKTGEVSRCEGMGEGAVCRLVADERLAYREEIKALSQRLDGLERKLESLTATPSSPPASERDNERMTSEEREKVDHFFDLSDQVMRRFFGMVKELKRDFNDDRL